MLEANSLVESDSLDTIGEEVEIRQRLSLYQVFLRLYEQNRGLLDEILNLENSGNRSPSGVMIPYIQGMVVGDQIHLVTNLTSGQTRAFSQHQHIWTIGRDSRKVALSIPDRRLSRCHAAIRYTKGQFQLIDLGSSNGSYVNGELIRHSIVLKDGDKIRLGSITFSFFIGHGVETLASVSDELLEQMDGMAVPTNFALPHRTYSSTGHVCNLKDSRSANGSVLEDTMQFLKSVEVQSSN